MVWQNIHANPFKVFWSKRRLFLPTAFMNASKFSWVSSWYFPVNDMVSDSERRKQSAGLSLLCSQTAGLQSLTTGVSNLGNSPLPTLSWCHHDRDQDGEIQESDWDSSQLAELRKKMPVHPQSVNLMMSSHSTTSGDLVAESNSRCWWLDTQLRSNVI